MAEQKSKSKIETFSKMFQFQESIFQNALLGLDESYSLQRPSENTNHINWLLGHIVHCRYMLGGMLGLKLKNPFGQVYWEPLSSEATYFNVAELREAFQEVSQALYQKLQELDDSVLTQQPMPDKPPLEGIISFLVYHEAYHIGQIGYARKLINLDALKSN